jgi:hypothetical protein
MVQKRRILIDDFKEYNLIRKSPAFSHPMKKAKLEKAEGTRALKEYAGKRMRFLLSSLYPEMSAERKKEIVNKFAGKTEFMHWITTLILPENYAYYDPDSKSTRVRKRSLNNQKEFTNTLDHEAVHFLQDEFKYIFPGDVDERIAYGVSSSLIPNEATLKEIKKIKKFSDTDLSIQLKSRRMAEKLTNAKKLEDIFIMKRGMDLIRDFPTNSIISSMSTILAKTDIRARNQFLRDAMEGKNPVVSFNNLMKQKGIQAVIEGRQLKIKKVKP